MWTDVNNYVKCCTKCQKHKYENRKPAGKLQPITTTRPNEMLGVDIMGPLPSSSPHRHEYLLVCVDYFTRWVELFPMRKANAETIASILRKEVFTRWGVPNCLLSDRGTQFVSSLFKELCAQWNITHKLTTAYHPQANMTERINRTLKCMIASYLDGNHKKWDQFLPEFRFALNSALQESIGMTPAELQLGRKLQGPLDILLQKQKVDLLPCDPPYNVVSHIVQLQEQAKENCTQAQKRQLRNYNKGRRELSFKNQDRVWLRNFPQSSALQHFSAKLAPKWKGPYRVIKQLGPLSYEIALESNGEDVRTTHVTNLKACYPTAADMEAYEKQRLREIFQDSSEDDTEFLGF